jgi:hypothetical protein
MITGNISAAFQRGADKRAELRHLLGMDQDTARSLHFHNQQDNKNVLAAGDETEQSNEMVDETEGATEDSSQGLHREEQRRGASNRLEAFRLDSGGYYRKQQHKDGSNGSEDGYTKDTVLHSNVYGIQHSIRKDNDAPGTPAQSKSPANPYNTGQTPLTHKYLGQCNDLYLHGSVGFTSADDFTEEYYSVFGFPPSFYTYIRNSFIQLLEDYETPYLDDKQIKNLPRLINLEPETFVDWYGSIESELMMISNIGLLPFDDITINYQYVGLCIPGVGERKYLEMARVLYRVCNKTMPHEVDAVKNAF